MAVHTTARSEWRVSMAVSRRRSKSAAMTLTAIASHLIGVTPSTVVVASTGCGSGRVKEVRL